MARQGVGMLAPRAVKRKTANKLSSGPVTPVTPASDGETETTTARAASADEKKVADEVVAEAGAASSGNGGSLSANHTGGEVEAGQPAGSRDTVDSTEERAKQKQETERLSLLRFTLEECLSDWGLSSQHPELLKKIGLSETGCELQLP